MKKFVIFSLIIGSMLSMAGCASDKLNDPGNFYYVRTEMQYGKGDSVICPERRELSGIRGQGNDLLELYLQGPRTRNLESPFPRNTKVISYSIVDETMLLELSSEFSELSGVDLSIACGCLTKTILELFPVKRINFRAEDSLLNGELFVSMSESNIQLFDDSLDRLRTEFTLYYSDDQRRYLIAKNISINLADQQDVIQYLIRQLNTPPQSSGLRSPLPSGTKLISASLDGKICRVHLSPEFTSRGWRTPEAQRLCLLSIVNTLTELDTVDGVEFYVENKLLTQYRLLNIPGPLVRDERAIGPVRSGINEFDASLYLANGSEKRLVCVPTRIRAIAGISQAELIIRELINYQDSNGFNSPIPDNADINYVDIENGNCYIDFTAPFIYNPGKVSQAIRSVIASVCSLEEIERVYITVNGEIPSGEIAPYFNSHTVNSDWIL